MNIIINHDPAKIFKLASLQSDEAKKILKEFALDTGYSQSIILILDGKVYRKSRAVLEIARRIGGRYRLLYLFRIIPSFILNICYDIIARYRYRIFGKRDVCRIPSAADSDRFL